MPVRTHGPWKTRPERGILLILARSGGFGERKGHVAFRVPAGVAKRSKYLGERYRWISFGCMEGVLARYTATEESQTI